MVWETIVDDQIFQMIPHETTLWSCLILDNLDILTACEDGVCIESTEQEASRSFVPSP